MNATASTTPALVAVPLEQIALGKNYRHRRPANWEAKLDELGESMKQNGQLEPVLLREKPKGIEAVRYEVVFGERRYRAAKKAGLETLLATVRDVSDDQVLPLQLAENDDRDDPHPLDEAEAFAVLVGRGQSPAEIAATRGRPVRYVRERLELTKLHPKALAALDAGEILLGHALLLCRIPEKLQPEALKEMALDDRGKDSMLSVGAAGNLVREKYMLKLATAPFDRSDFALVPKAGACTVCPKRTGNQGELFGDVKSPDVCTDPVCFRGKLDAHFKKTVKAGGHKVAPAKDVQFSKWSDHISSSKWVALDDSRYLGSGNVKIRTLVGKDAETALAQNPHSGAIVELVSRAVVDKAAKSYQASKAKKGKGSAPARDKVTASEKARRAREAAKAQAKEAITMALGAAVAEGFSGEPEDCTEALRLMFAEFLGSLYDGAELLVKRRQLLPEKKGNRRSFPAGDVDGALGKLGKTLELGELVAVLLETFVLDKLDIAHKPSEQLVASALKLCGVDRKKVEAEVLAAEAKRKEAEKAAALASKPKAKKAAKKKGRKS
jgi:ParB/RepB/Spo0J family partition protein